jgi:hypothetical protein
MALLLSRCAQGDLRTARACTHVACGGLALLLALPGSIEHLHRMSATGMPMLLGGTV